MGDEDLTEQFLPQRPKRSAEARHAPPLSEELRQRMQAAVKAERARAMGQEPADLSREAVAPAPADPGVAVPAVGQDDHAAQPAPPALPDSVEPERKITPDPAARPRPAGGLPAGGNPAVLPAPSAPAGAHMPAARRRFIATAAIATVLVLLAAGSLGVAVARYITASRVLGESISPAEQRAEAAARHRAAAWITQQVSHTAVISCDPLMCAALTADGFPARNVRVLGPTALYPLTSAVVVVTQAVRDLFGSSLSSDYAPAVLATFGSAEASITVRVIAPHGAAAYWRQFGADLKARKAVGLDLIGISAITLSATAKQQMLAGQPDARLLLAIAAAASRQPVDILDFGNIGPGSDQTIPLRFADLAESDQAAHMASSAYLRALRANLGATGYRPVRMVTVVLPSGYEALRIEFAAPSPLSLLGPQASLPG